MATDKKHEPAKVYGFPSDLWASYEKLAAAIEECPYKVLITGIKQFHILNIQDIEFVEMQVFEFIGVIGDKYSLLIHLDKVKFVDPVKIIPVSVESGILEAAKIHAKIAKAAKLTSTD
jgi:hypothetical protein